MLCYHTADKAESYEEISKWGEFCLTPRECFFSDT